MKTRRRQYDSEDVQTISRRRNRREYSDPIPVDLIIEILSRLPLKSIARFHCVSKLWDSLLRRPDFTAFFMTRSSSRPQLLVSFKENGALVFFSSPQDVNSSSSSSPVSANHLMRFPFDRYCKIGGLICGLVSRIVKKRKETVPMLCNISTGQSLALPKVKTRRVRVKIFLGYDPIDKQFKLLAMTWIERRAEITEEHQVLTLGTQKPSWRMIKCDVPHYPVNNGICISGVLYYQARDSNLFDVVIVCFDVRSEKFMLINRDDEMSLWCDSTLINYKGRLGVLLHDGIEVNDETSCLELWVLVDAEKHEWSKQEYVLPSLWKNLVADASLVFVGLTGTNEIILSPSYMSSPSMYVFYYDMEKKSVRRVEIQGMDEFQHCSRIHMSLEHVEDVNLMQMFRTL